MAAAKGGSTARGRRKAGTPQGARSRAGHPPTPDAAREQDGNGKVMAPQRSTDKREPYRAPPLRVAIIDPHPLTRERIAEIVEARGGEAIWTTGTVQDALDRASQLSPDCVIFEFGLPDGSGAQILAELRAVCPFVCGVAVSGYDQHAYRALTYAAGGVGYLTKAVGADSIATALQEVLAGRLLWTVQEITMARAWWTRCAEPWRRLSPRQRTVALGVAAHLTNKEIAARLGLRESTVKGYLPEILARVGVLTRRGKLAAWMKASCLTDPLVRPLLDLRGGAYLPGEPGAQRRFDEIQPFLLH